MSNNWKVILFVFILAAAFFTLKIVARNKGKDMSDIFDDLIQDYGREIARNVERIYRLESGNFTSGQYNGTYSAGMRSFDKEYPFGWDASEKFWRANPALKPIGVKYYKSRLTGMNNGYVQFKDFAGGAYTLAEFLKRHGNNAGRWHSTTPEVQDEYVAKLNQMKTIYT